MHNKKTVFAPMLAGVAALAGACGTAPPKVGGSAAPIEEHNYALSPPARPGRAYFVLLHPNGAGAWEILQIEDQRLLRRSIEQEVLAVDIDSGKYWPDYEKLHLSAAGTTFVCTSGGYMSAAHQREGYNGCNSKLVDASWTLERAWGETVVVHPDYAKLAGIVRDLGVIRAVQNCYLARVEDQRFLDSIDVQPNIVDRSGYYAGEDLLQVIKRAERRRSCPIDPAGEPSFGVDLRQASGSPYELAIEPSSYSGLEPQFPGPALHPQVTIRRRQFNSLLVNRVFAGKEMNVSVSRIDASSEGIRVNCELHNKTQHFLSIKAVSIGLDHDAVTTTLSTPLNIPPSATAEHSFTLAEMDPSHARPRLSKDEAASKTLGLSVSVLYDDAGSQKTFHRVESVSYAEILGAH